MEKEKKAMRFKPLIFLGLVLTLLIVYLLFLEIPSEKRKNEEDISSKKALLFKEEEVKGYEIRSDIYNITAERDAGRNWRITEPVKTDPEPDRISRFLTLVENLEIKRVVEAKYSDLKIYGLDRPQMEITIILKDKKEKLILGNRGPVKNTLYIRREGDEKVLLVDDRLIEDIPDKFSTWRRSKVLPFDVTGVDEVRLEYGDKSFHITRESGKWILKRPIETRADQSEINDILSTLASLSARDFVDEKKEDLIKTVSPPKIRVGIKVSGEEKVVSFYIPGGSEKEIIYAMVTPQEPVYKIDRSFLNRLDKNLYGLRDKRILDLKDNEVNRIEITRKDEIIRIAREGKGWILDGKSDQKVDVSRATDLINLLKDIKAERFVDNPPIDLSKFGLNPPNSVINLYDKGNNPLGAVLFGREQGGMIYAKNNASKSVLMVKKEALRSIPARKDLINKLEEKGD